MLHHTNYQYPKIVIDCFHHVGYIQCGNVSESMRRTRRRMRISFIKSCLKAKNNNSKSYYEYDRKYWKFRKALSTISPYKHFDLS